MSMKPRFRVVLPLIAIAFACLGTWQASPFGAPGVAGKHDLSLSLVGAQATGDALERRLSERVQPFLERYCLSCHSGAKPKADLDLKRDWTMKAIASNATRWMEVLARLEACEMPPPKAPNQPTPDERAAVVAWIRDLRDHEARRNAGDPGVVLARRLSNAEFDYTIRDLTGVDIRPTREFPVDPANQAGFDNSGESLAMSPALLKKYLTAARLVADHVALKPDGFVFAPHPVATETDRDKYCVARIVDFYKRHPVDYAAYFQAAHAYRHRDKLGRGKAALADFANDAGVSAKYLAMIWSVLAEPETDAGPLAALRQVWSELPESAEAARPGCERMRDLVTLWRKQFKPEVKKLQVSGISPGSQTMVLWRNRQLTGQHRRYSGTVSPDLKKLAEQLKGANANLASFFPAKAPDETPLRKALERFCSVFPDAFVVVDRGPYFDPNAAGKGRPLTAGFHLMQGYFRDDDPLCELILDAPERHELDQLWHDLNFMTLAPMRQFRDFIFFERAEPPRFMFEAEFDFARSEDRDAVSAAKMERLAKAYLAKARKKEASDEAIAAIETYFTGMSAEIRKVECDRLAAEPSHLAALVKFAERAYRRPLAGAEAKDLLAFYRRLREKNDLSHEDALSDALVSVLLSPHFCYRVNLTPHGKGITPLDDYALASRLSYFLWSSMPDTELLAHASKGDLHTRDVLIAQTRRMLRDPKVHGLATEFAGNWLDFRRFEEHNAVDRQRFPAFTNELRQAMFEEPVRFFMDIAKRNRSVLDMLYGKDTFVNPLLAKHYGMPDISPRPSGERGRGEGDWVHIEDADRYGRGGVLPMAVFLTKNAPGLRTSPVKRGYWVVRRVLGEQIPPPPPTVPELPQDEAKLGDLTLPQLLARHRADQSCAGCHRRFDAIGLVFETFGPIGERRNRDLGGRAVQTSATFPDGKDRDGLTGLREYLREKRERDFVDNLCKKLFSYALGRSLLISDTQAVDTMRNRLAADGYSFGSLVESIVTSPQFLNRRARDDSRE
jgi:hypothetical protein